MNTNPTHGSRVRFDLQRGTDESATYDVTVYEGSATHAFTAVLDVASGEVTFAPLPADAPPDTQRSVLPFAKQILSSRRASPTGLWPRRVLRWRAGRGA